MPTPERAFSFSGSRMESARNGAVPADKPPPPPEGQPLIHELQEDPGHKKDSPLLRQLLAAAGPMAVITSSGMTAGFSAVLLPQLEGESSSIPITKDQASWIASMAALPMALGCLMCGVLMERYGRRATHQLVCVPYVVGWVVLSLARNVAMLYIGRFLTGLCVGLIGPLCPVFIAETSSPQYRGALLAMVSLAVSTGILLSHILGTYLHWQLASAISAVFPLLCYVAVFWVPESPVWLAARQRHDQAARAFLWYRGHSAESSTELRDLLERSATPTEHAWTELWAEARKVTFLKPFVVMNMFFFVQQFSGVNAVAFYTVSILQQVGGRVNEYDATILLGVVRVVMSAVACVLTRRYGRRLLTLISCMGTAASLFALGASLSVPWAPELLLIAYICFISVGLVPLPWVMVGEVFPAAARGLGSGVSSSFCFVVFFIVVKTLPALIVGVGPDGTFFTYASISLVGAVFLYFFLPETKNRTLQQIEQDYKGSKTEEC